MNKHFLWTQACLAILTISLFFSCTVTPLSEAVESLPSVSSPKTVTNLSATTTNGDSITVSFSGLDVPDGYSQYYSLYYWNMKDTGKTNCKRLSSGSSSYTFSNLSAGTQMVFWMTTTLVNSSDSTDKQTSASSAMVEGATLPSLDMTSVVDGSSVSLSWVSAGLFSALNQTVQTPLHAYAYTLEKTIGMVESEASLSHANSYSEELQGSNQDVSYEVILHLYDADGNQFAAISSGKDSFTTDISKVPPRATSLVASQGTAKDSITLDWTLSDFNEGIEDDIEHRVLLERAVHGSDSWTTLIKKSDAINTEAYGYVEEGTGGNASYSYNDTTAETNVEYDYRITTYYYLNGSVYQKQSGSLLTTGDEPGYLVWLPTDLTVVDGEVSGEQTASVTIPVTLSWTYPKPLPSGMRFILVRSDEFLSVALSTTMVGYEDSITLNYNGTENDDTRSDHTYSYAIKVDYGDGTYSPSVSGNDTVAFVSTCKPIDFITATTSTTDLAKRIVFTWTENSTEMTAKGLTSDNLSYTFQVGNSEEERNGASSTPITVDGTVCTKSGDVYTYRYDASDSTSKYFKLVATCDTSDAVYDGLTSTETFVGQALTAPSSLTAGQGVSTTSIDISFSSVANAASYKLYYRKHSDTEYVAQALDSDTTTFALTEGAGTSNAGTVYDFQVSAVDVNGDETEKSEQTQGCLFGPAMLSTVATKNTSKDRFSVTWNSIKGAAEYQLQAYLGTNIVYSATITQGSETSHTVTITSSDIGKTDANPTPLSEQYEVKVIPSTAGGDSVAEEMVSAVTGCWVRPPKNIVGSKGTSGTTISVSWDKVDDADSYRVYRKNVDGDSWSVKQSVSTNSFEDNNVGIYYYTVRTVINGIESELQDSFTESDGLASNYGCTFLAPKDISTNYSIGAQTTSITWSRALNASSYVVTVSGDKYFTVTDGGSTVSVSDNTSGVTVTAENLDEDTISCTLPTPFVSTYDSPDDLIGYTFCIMSKNGTLESPNSSVYGVYPVTELTNANMKDMILSYLKGILTTANSTFGSDWWRENAGTTDGGVTGVTVKTCYAPQAWSSTMLNGTFRIASALFGTYGLSANTAADIELTATGEGLAGYLGDDPLKYIGVGSITFSYPAMAYLNNATCEDSPSAVFKITTAIDVKNNTGVYSVTWNSGTTSYDYSSGDLF